VLRFATQGELTYAALSAPFAAPWDAKYLTIISFPCIRSAEKVFGKSYLYDDYAYVQIAMH
jgi:hypothetical protein